MKRYSVRVFFFPVILLALMQAGCGKFFSNSNSSGGGGGTSTTAFVYVASNTEVFAFKADLTSGNLTTLSNSASGSSPTAMVIDPGNHFLYVAASGGLNGFVINSNGTLSTINLGALSQGSLPVGLAINSSGNTLYDLDSLSGTISAFSIASNGTLTALTGAQVNVTGTPSALVIDPAARHLYAALGGAGILTVTINSNGSLTQSSTLVAPPTGSSFTALAITPSGRNLYAATTGGVVAFSFDSNGIPVALNGGAVVRTSNNPSALAVDPGGSFLFVANNDASSVSSFAILGSGALTPITGSPFATASSPTGIAVDPKTKFVFVSDTQGLQSLAINTAVPGQLTLKATANAGNSPAAVVSTH